VIKGKDKLRIHVVVPLVSLLPLAQKAPTRKYLQHPLFGLVAVSPHHTKAR
jgi:hypothetical protein